MSGSQQRLFVGNLPLDIESQELNDVFSTYGKRALEHCLTCDFMVVLCVCFFQVPWSELRLSKRKDLKTMRF